MCIPSQQTPWITLEPHSEPTSNLRRSRSLGLLQLFSPSHRQSREKEKIHHGMVESTSFAGKDALCGKDGLYSGSPSHSLASRLRERFGKASSLRQSNSFHGRLFQPAKSARKQTMNSKDAEVALRYLRELVRTDKMEMIPACSSAIFDAVAHRINDDSPELKDALLDFLAWTDRFCTYAGALQANGEKENAYATIDALETALHGVPSRPSPLRTSSTRKASPPVLRAKGKAPLLNERSVSLQHRPAPADQSIDDLMRQLNLREVAKFEPVFPDVDADSEDEDGVTVKERTEERAEKHGQKLCEEEVEKMADGSEIRRKKTRTVNMQQSSKHTTISTRGGGLPSNTRTFLDGSQNFDNDEDFQTTASADFFNRFNKMRRKDPFAGVQESIDGEESSEPNQTTKKKTLEKTSEVLQSVEENKKKNGKLMSINAAHQKDITELKAIQVETYKGNELLDRKGDGSYEEATIFRRGLPGCSLDEGGDEGTPRKHVVEYVQTFGAKNNTAEDFFRGCTLASYITLNDNLRFHEEQFRKKLAFEFSSSAGSSNDFSKLNDLLQATDFVNVKMPTKYAIMEDLETCEVAAGLPENVAYPERPALTGDIAILHSFDAREYLVRHPSDSAHRPDEVRGGPKDALLVFCTQNSSLLYQEAFIAAYRSFMPSDEVVQKLITRYLFMESRQSTDAVKQSHQTFSLLVRIVDELCKSELTESMINSVTAFVYHLIRQGHVNLARILRKRLLDRIENLHVNKPENGPFPHIDVTPRKNNRPDVLSDFKSLPMAQQITLLDAVLFEKIEPAELLWWAVEQSDDRCPNLRLFTQHFNKISYWVRTMIITSKDQKEREKTICKLIKVMKQLRRIGNLHSYLAMLSALDSGPIRRLDWPKSIVEHLNQHSAVMDSTFSFKNYRTLLSETAPPCIPYIGLVLQDLTFVHVGNRQHLTKEQVGDRSNLINYNKIWQQYAILDSMRKFKRWSYTFEKDDRIVRFLNNFDKHLNEEETWQLSEKIKPRKWANKV